MIARSIREITLAVSRKEKLNGIVLSKSSDLICNNIMCEKLSEPCICKLERVLERVDKDELELLDLSSNSLSVLPPSVEKFHNLKHLDISGNKFDQGTPEFIDKLQLKSLKT